MRTSSLVWGMIAVLTIVGIPGVGHATTGGKGEQRAFCDYWPLAKGNQWTWNTGMIDFGYETIAIVRHVDVYGIPVWQVNFVTDSIAGPQTRIVYLALVDGWFYETEARSDIDLLPTIANGLQRLFPEQFELGVPISIVVNGTAITLTPEIGPTVGNCTDTITFSGMLVLGRNLGPVAGTIFGYGAILEPPTIVGGCDTPGEGSWTSSITPSATPGFIGEGTPLMLTAPAGSNYQWIKNEVPLTDDPPRVLGTREQTLVFNPVLMGDIGLYACRYDDGTKAIVETEVFILKVEPQGSLPVGGVAALLAMIALGAASRLRKKKDPVKESLQ